MSETVVSIGHNRMPHIAKRIQDAYDRTIKIDCDWVEASVELAIALREGSENTPGNMSFSYWLKSNNLDNVLNANDRAALISMARDPELMRTVLKETPSRSYQLIWRHYKSHFTSARKKPASAPKRRR